MTVEGVAVALDTSQTSIWRYEAGQRRPSGPTLHALAGLYNKATEWFFGEEEAETQPRQEPAAPEDSGNSTDSTYEDDIAFIESQPELSFKGLQGDLTPEEAREVRNFIEYTLAKREQRGRSEDNQGGD